MFYRIDFFRTPLLVLAIGFSITADAVEDAPSDFTRGTKVIVDVGGETVGEIIDQVAPGVFRVRVKLSTGQLIEPALPPASLRRAPPDATFGTSPEVANTNADGVTGTSDGSVTAGTVTPGTVTPGTVTPGTVTPGTVTPGSVSPGTVIPGSTQGPVKVTPGTITPGTVTPGTVTPGTITQGTTSAGANVTQTVTPGTVTSGKVTPGVVISGSATPGASAAGTVEAKAGSVGTGVVVEEMLAETPAGKEELRSLAGAWKVMRVSRDGGVAAKEPQKITITPTSITIGDLSYDRVRLDPTSHPRRMDLLKGGDVPLRAIYERNGTRLRICAATVEGFVRPTEFETSQGDGRILYEAELNSE